MLNNPVKFIDEVAYIEARHTTLDRRNFEKTGVIGCPHQDA